jgi:flagellar biosynthesis/type III secretory pathway chaperone
MNPALRQLNALIEKKIALYDKFILLLKEQWSSITDYSLESLQTVLVKKEALVDQIQALEAERLRLMGKINSPGASAGADRTLKQIIQITPGPLGVQLKKRREVLLDRIVTINGLHENLKGLMDRSSLSLKKNLVLFHSKGEEASSPYHPNGKLQEGNMQGRMLNLDA